MVNGITAGVVLADSITSALLAVAELRSDDDTFGSYVNNSVAILQLVVLCGE